MKWFDTFSSASQWGIWPSKPPTFQGIWPKPFKKRQIPRGLRGGMGSFVIDWLVHYVCDLTQAHRELKAWFPYDRYDRYDRSDCCDRWKKKFSYCSDHSDHTETWLFRVCIDDDRWDRTTLSYSITSKIPTLSSIWCLKTVPRFEPPYMPL